MRRRPTSRDAGGRSGGAGAGLRRALLAGAALAACAPQPPLPDSSLPLVELLDAARAVVETDAIDVGAPEDRGALWSGWSADEAYPGGTFAWGAGERSLVRFEVVEPRDRRLRLRGWSYPFGDAPAQEVRFALGGREVARKKLASEPGTVEIELPAGALEPGENFLELRYARVARGEMPWAAGWDTLRFDGPRTARALPRVERGAGRIVLPARTGYEWTLELPGGSWLAWRNLVATGGARLAISVAGEEGARREARPRSGAGRLRLSQPAEPHRLRRVALRALGSGGEVRIAGLRLHAPELASVALAARPGPSAAPAPAPAGAAAAARPNLLVYVVDTLRADHLGCYGYPRPTSPAIDAFARAGVRWSEGRAQASWTRPAMATLLSGLQPIGHRVLRNPDKLPDEVATVADRLRAAGYETAFFTPNAHTSPRFGFDRGWDLYRYEADRARGVAHPRSAERINEAAFDFLARRDRARPFLAVVHTMDPHDAYVPREPYRSRLAGAVADPSVGRGEKLRGLRALPPEAARRRARDLVALYDGEIAQNDAAFGDLLGELERLGLAGSTAVVLTSDHGEEFYEHGGWKHGFTLYEEQLRIPFVARLPGGRGAGSVVRRTAEQIDLLPTLLELAGLPADPALPGRSLLADLDGEPVAPRASFAWLERPGTSLAAVVRQEWKLVRGADVLTPPVARTPARLFALGSDPEERRDLALERPLCRAWLDGQLATALARWRSARGAEEVALDPETERSLRALGYL
jgi:arylsulfatase A-like enzyme